MYVSIVTGLCKFFSQEKTVGVRKFRSDKVESAKLHSRWNASAANKVFSTKSPLSVQYYQLSKLW